MANTDSTIEYTTVDGDTLTVTKLSYLLTAREMKTFQEAGNTLAETGDVETFLSKFPIDDKQRDQILDLKLVDFNKFIPQWVGEAALGES